MNAPAKAVAVSRPEKKETIIFIPLNSFSEPTIGPPTVQCMGCANSIFSLFFSDCSDERAYQPANSTGNW